MWFRTAGALVVLACVAGCTTLSDTPATAPPASGAAAAATTTTSRVDISTTSTTAVTTTTLDRVAEIEMIFLDLERRRLRAILDQDEAAYRAVFANEYYEEESMIVFDTVEVIDPEAVVLSIGEVLVDRPDCIAAGVAADQSGVSSTGGFAEDEWVLEPTQDGWGFSWVGRGWLCDSPHPLLP